MFASRVWLQIIIVLVKCTACWELWINWNKLHSYVTIVFSDCNIIGGKEGIHFTFVRDGRPSGEAYIELATEEDTEKALAKNKQHMGKRYIEGMTKMLCFTSLFCFKKSAFEYVVWKVAAICPGLSALTLL